MGNRTMKDLALLKVVLLVSGIIAIGTQKNVRVHTLDATVRCLRVRASAR